MKCEMESPETFPGKCDGGEPCHREAVSECLECGFKLCRECQKICPCGEVFCDFCINEYHFPRCAVNPDYEPPDVPGWEGGFAANH